MKIVEMEALKVMCSAMAYDLFHMQKKEMDGVVNSAEILVKTYPRTKASSDLIGNDTNETVLESWAENLKEWFPEDKISSENLKIAYNRTWLHK